MTRSIETVNPATGEKIASYELYNLEKVVGIAKQAKETFHSKWSKLPISEREEHLRSLSRALRSKKSDYAKLMTLEMGKPIVQSEAEVEKCAWAAGVYAENAEEWLQDEYAKTDSKHSYVTYEPLGVILSIMPWNFPFWQAFRFTIPALAAGNTSILRHASICTGSGLAIQEAFEIAGFPEGVFTTIVTDHETVSKLIESDPIVGVSLTGSVGAGQVIGEVAAKNLKKCVLELGGSDPFIVLSNADVDAAAKTAAEARLLNSGQSCICAKRFIVEESIAKEFTDKLVSEFKKKKTGDPMDRNIDVGPLSSTQAVATIDVQVRDAVSKQSRVLIGGKQREGLGAFYEPTVLDRVGPNMKVMSEEVFGPVAPVLGVRGEDEAIRIANDSEFGLGASLWTEDLDRAKNLAKRIESGMVFVNSLVKSDPRMPFGGIKKSGIGRELSKFGLKEFVNIKSINVYETTQKKIEVQKIVSE
ncbi:MAG TPA: NAD-dependent succinate-semialdehyde dehydrogenase [Nitrososphaerales archaeon]|nr:NAD-dependent succinate-semialdehyde dehydrogenase [Nitrososphaerales archaeon]